ncbi:MAG: organomercurial lyase [Sulfuriferula sp.]
MTGPSTNHIIHSVARLRREFPLQARIEATDTVTRAAYAMVLQAWLQNGAAPRPHVIPRHSLDKLVGLDALVESESGLGCYPFSAVETGITVDYGVHRVHAMCAIDALAIPFLANTAATIIATCSVCDLPVRVQTDAVGQITQAVPAGVHVAYRKLAQEHVVCCTDLCPGIVFVCPACIGGDAEDSLSIDDAAEVGRQFFGFQRKGI